MFKITKIIFLGTIFLITPFLVSADYLGQTVTFNIDPSYDLEKREEISATLKKISNQLYFYVDNEWWQGLSYSEKQSFDVAFYNLAIEFERKIYPTLVSNFGSEPKPGIDADERITVLFHPMIKDAGGYINTGDGYSKLQNPKSNQREMFYLNTKYLGKEISKSFLAHEFTHLITFNQKDLLRGVSEERWLNEARAEIASTLLGYDQTYEGSNLQIRVKDFLENPSDSLTEWLNKKADYGVINLFSQYLIDHYGIRIFSDSLKSDKVGIPSLNYALEKNGFKEDFEKIFTDWMIAVILNDCSLGEKYCYLNVNLKDLRIIPQINFLPLAGEVTLVMTHMTKNWSGNWFKIIGGKGDLKFEFDGEDKVNFKISYLICDKKEKCSVNFLNLDENQKGVFNISNFNEKYSSLVLIPSIQSKISDFNGEKNTYTFSFTITTREGSIEKKELELKKKLLAQIEFLEKEIARLRAEINTILTKKGQKIETLQESFQLPTGQACTFFENNLYYGMMNNSNVRCLQEFLKAQGPEIYPEGLVTGNFLSLTQKAVIRFQEKYALEILAPLGLEKGTGYVGERTRAKINQLLQ